MSIFRVCLAVAFLLPLPRLASSADSWPEWRGRDGQGRSSAENVPVSWSETENVAWKTEVPGLGWSTPVVGGGQVWVTTAHDTPAPKEEAERRRKTSTNSQPLTISSFVSLRALCFDFDSGKLLKNVEVMTQKDPQMIHVQNTYATPTPILDGARLYCHYGPSGMACVDVDSGDVRWRNNESLLVKHENGPGSSPILHGDYLIVHCDGIDQQYIIALDKETGKEVWRTPRSGKLHEIDQLRKAYATPLVTELDGVEQIVSPAADWIYGYEPKTGGELWRLNYGQLGFSNSARPIAGAGMIFTCTGYTKSQMLAIRVEQKNDQWQPEVAWRFTKQVPNVSSPLMVGDEIYFASDNGIATCLDARTGKAHWTERIGKRYWAAPVFADGRIYFFERDGETMVVAPGKEFQKLSVNKLDGTLFAAGAPVDGAMILRTDKALYRLSE